MAVELSVAVPLFRAKYIGWLCFWGLLNQKKVNFEWELVIAEEQNDESIGREKILSLSKGLKDVGCVRIKYFSLGNWMPLARKHKFMVDKCDTSSRIIAHNGADDLHAPLWLHEVHKAFSRPKVDWFKQVKAIHYNIKTGETVLFDISNMPHRTDCIGRAVKLDLLRNLPASNRRSSCDRWLFHQAYKKGINFYTDKSDNWKYGLSTWGLNNLSLSAGYRFKKIVPPWYECPIDIQETISPKVLELLALSSDHIKEHDTKLPWLSKKRKKRKKIKGTTRNQRIKGITTRNQRIKEGLWRTKQRERKKKEEEERLKRKEERDRQLKKEKLLERLRKAKERTEIKKTDGGRSNRPPPSTPRVRHPDKKLRRRKK